MAADYNPSGWKYTYHALLSLVLTGYIEYLNRSYIMTLEHYTMTTIYRELQCNDVFRCYKIFTWRVYLALFWGLMYTSQIFPLLFCYIISYHFLILVILFSNTKSLLWPAILIWYGLKNWITSFKEQHCKRFLEPKGFSKKHKKGISVWLCGIYFILLRCLSNFLADSCPYFWRECSKIKVLNGWGVGE